MRTTSYGRLGGTKIHRKIIIIEEDVEKSRLCRICDRNNKVIPVRDVLGILRFSALLYTEDTTTIYHLDYS